MIQNTDPFGRTHVTGKPVNEQWLKNGDVIHAGHLALLDLEDKGEDDLTSHLPRPPTPFQPPLPDLLSNPPKPEILDPGGNSRGADELSLR